MYDLLCVACGGALGATLRWSWGLLLGRCLPSNFPYATFSVNVLGSLLIGLAVALLSASTSENSVKETYRLFLVTGLLGGFTTWSSFSLEITDFAMQMEIAKAFVHLGGQLLLSLGAVWLGLRLGQAIS